MATQSRSSSTNSHLPSVVLSRRVRWLTGSALVTLFALMLLMAYLMPFAYMSATALKDMNQITEPGAPLWPARKMTFQYNIPYEVQSKDTISRLIKLYKNYDVTTDTLIAVNNLLPPDYALPPEGTTILIPTLYPVYKLPTDEGVKLCALVTPYNDSAVFVDTQNPEAGTFEWLGNWRSLEPVWEFSARWENFQTVWVRIKFPLLMYNTIAIAVVGVIGTLLSCIVVAYGFSRFRIPGKSILFMVLMGTIILPRFITLIPTYAVFAKIGWVGTWLPLLVPHFFANAYNTFLLRQYFLTIPREMDEAAMIDGASPLHTLISVIVPQAVPAIVAVSLFHFFYAWNDFFEPMIYLSQKPDLQPIAVGVQNFNFIYGREPHLIQATALMGLVLPLIIFFLAQRVFMQGVVFTGVEK